MSALRVPSLVPGLWVHLRAWDHREHAAVRSHGGSAAVVASQDAAFVRVDGLVPMWWSNGASTEEVDAVLMAMGAEAVPPGEWPDGCFGGGAHEDRRPFCFLDLTEEEQLRVARMSSWWWRRSR